MQQQQAAREGIENVTDVASMGPVDQLAVGEREGERGAWGRSPFSDLEVGEKGGTVSLGER